MNWRRALPPEFQLETADVWSRSSVWVFVLRALACRLECLVYRDVSGQTHEQDAFRRRAAQKQQNAMLELDSILRRIMLYDLVEHCPFSLSVFIYPFTNADPR